MVGVIVSALIVLCVYVTERGLDSRRIPGPARVHVAARNKVPGLIMTSIQPEIVNQQRAWEVRGTDQNGTIWLIDVWDSGEVVGAEPIAHLPPPSVAEPEPDF